MTTDVLYADLLCRRRAAELALLAAVVPNHGSGVPRARAAGVALHDFRGGDTRLIWQCLEHWRLRLPGEALWLAGRMLRRAGLWKRGLDRNPGPPWCVGSLIHLGTGRYDGRTVDAAVVRLLDLCRRQRLMERHLRAATEAGTAA